MYKLSVSHRGTSVASLRALVRQALLPCALTILSSGLLLVSTEEASQAAEPTTTKKAEPKPAETKAPESKAAPTPAAETKKAEPKATDPAAATTKSKPATTATAEKPEDAAAEAEGPAAPTEEQQAASKAAFEAGAKAFGEEDYATALTEFEKAYESVPSAEVEYWIARALDANDAENEKAGEVVAAYSKFLSNPGAQHVGADRVSEAQARVVELKKLLPAQIKLITIPEGASLTIDGQPYEGKTPVDLELPAGAHKFEISLEGYEPTMVEMDVQGGSAVEQEVTLAEVPPEPEAEPVAPPPAEPAAKRSLVPAAVTLGLGGAGLISGTLFGIMALGAKKDFKDDPTTANADTAERNALIADMSFGIALTLGITGIVLLTAEDEEAAADATARAKKNRVLVAPYASKQGGGVAGLFRF